MADYKEIADNLLQHFTRYIVNYEFILAPSGRVQKLRIELINYAVVDIYYSKTSGKYSFHYEDENNIYRHDNSPHHPDVNTFPKHSHFNETVDVSHLSGDILQSSLEFFQLMIEKFINK